MLARLRDPAAQDATSASALDGSICWTTRASAFPRRGEFLFLRLSAQSGLLAEFKIQNPACGLYPQWKPQPFPISAVDAGLSVDLVSLESYQTGVETFTKNGVYPRTVSGFRVRENGQDTQAWQVSSFEVWDATGNHWRPPLDPGKRPANETGVVASFLGALWKGEGAWKLRVQLEPTDRSRASDGTRTVEFMAAPSQVQVNTGKPIR